MIEPKGDGRYEPWKEWKAKSVSRFYGTSVAISLILFTIFVAFGL
jgi:hypothetical protein